MQPRAVVFSALITAFLIVGSVLPAQSQPRAQASSAARVAITAADAERMASGTYRLTWSQTSTETAVSIYVSGRPDAAPAQMHRLATDVRATRYEATVPDSIARPYFVIQPDREGAGRRTATRVLPLEGGRNFRDLGGYAAAEGQRVKWGTVYRSGVLSNLTDADYDYLEHLGIKVVCDFRSSDERVSETTNWRGASTPKIISWGYTNESGDDLKTLFSGDLTAEKMHGVMIEMYTRIAYQHADKYATMFRHVAEGKTPLLFHCSAGKDRAGTGTALLLSALGVDRETIVQDYALSDDVVDYEAEYSDAFENPQEEGGIVAKLARLSPEVRAPLFESDPAYIQSMFATLEEEHGSVAGFIKEVMGVRPETLAQMRARLLE
ncbi:tyrosine-protein phosphatase [Salinibacter grassmerensis]|uniref:tyrosine-protein phosphatase n=1 Tax=Salinibacter grassmerensis TaxID=3040353 RepID=UPI0021E7F598|nr:tyrosine-protein phosphatase [Salinibacter grassmerensis]